MLQVVQRVWPPAAVHDTVEAVIRGAAFRRSLQASVAERLLQWLSEWMSRLSDLLRGAPSARTIALGVAAVLVLVVVVRLIVAAGARDADALATSAGRRGATAEDPWSEADRMVAEGRYEEAAHALYRGVLSGL